MRREPHDLFYWENHRRHDAELHDPILSDGDYAAARAISDAIMRRLGFTDRQIAELANSKSVVKAFNEDEPRDEDGRWSGGGSDSGGGGGGFEFVSPSVASDLGLHDAISALSSKQQGALKTVSREIDQSLGLAGKPADAIGAWSDGAENTVVTVHSGTRAADYDKIAVAASMKGYIADQKGVLVFQEEEPDSPAGDAVLLSFSAKGSLAEIHQNLLSDGLAFHTLVPASGGATVYVAATEAKDVKGVVDATGRAAERYDSKITYRHGRGEFIGDFSSDGSDREQRDRARAVYETRIQQSTVPGSQAIWQGISDKWSKAADKIAVSFRREFNENEPRDEDGRWSGGGGGGGGGTSVADYSPGLKAVNDNASIRATKSDWIATSPIKTFDDVLRAAPKAQSALGEVGAGIADKLGVEFKNPGPKTKNEKGIARTKDKIAARGGNNAAVTDVARGTFIVSHPSQVEAIVADLSKHFQVTLENWRKTDLGYMDRAALVRFDNGLIGEVQFMDAGMANAKSDTGGDGHGLYVKWRALDLDKPSERVVADGLVADMRKLYGAVTEAYPPEWKAALGSSGT